MIKLNHSKEKMLAEIGTSLDVSTNFLTDPTASEFVSRQEASLRLVGKTKDELREALEPAFIKRFSHIDQERLFVDLLYPLKKGLGNAQKWGNKKDPNKNISVETTVTDGGAVIAITDEGAGFDVQGILGRFQQDEHYFTHGGSGFKQFEKTKAIVSYADSGRTLLIRFLCTPEPGSPLDDADQLRFGLAGDRSVMQSVLASSLSKFHHAPVEVKNCDIYKPDEMQNGQCELRYGVTYHQEVIEDSQSLILSGRLLPTAAAQTDFSFAQQLYHLQRNAQDEMLIPMPIGIVQEPSMVLFAFNPSGDLRKYMKYLKKNVEFEDILQHIKKVAVALRSLHQSSITLENEQEWTNAFVHHQTTQKRVLNQLALNSPQHITQFESFFDGLMQRASSMNSAIKVPTHGSLSWGSILHQNNNLYLYGFEQGCYTHPGFDIGGFLAGLAEFYILPKKGRESLYRAAETLFLNTYFVGQPSSWRQDIPFFIANATFLRLGELVKQPKQIWASKIDNFLDYCSQLV